MDITQILEQLKSERDHLNDAIAALEGVKTAAGPRKRAAAKGRGQGRRRMSAEARRRISEAQKKRWARQRKTSKSA
jgi:hypothetical protein